MHKAADAQAVTQSAISKSLQSLEAELGGVLMERSARGVSLTRFGEVFYSRALRIENECVLTRRVMGDIASGQAGSLTIGAGSAWLSVFVPQVLAKLHEKKPLARFTVLSSAGASFTEQFANGLIDIGLGSLDSIPQISDEYAYEPLSVIN
ncbi:MAG: LysR family transcriptional regulator, partial [Rhodospirillales bacterium]|nr:LysR family transcriptional regulator [Rhodospirillales bacterium]